MNYPEGQEQHVYHHSDPAQPKVTVSVEKNTKGYNWSASVNGAATVEEAMNMLKEAEKALNKEYGEPPVNINFSAPVSK